MKWTVEYFRVMAKRWLDRSTATTRPGHVAYALRQEAMWSGLADHARGVFDQVVVLYRV